MHLMNANETQKEKVRSELYKNTVCCVEQMLEEAPHKAATVRTWLNDAAEDRNLISISSVTAVHNDTDAPI